MKTRNTIIILLALIMGFSTGCNKEELENLRQQNQQLTEQIEKKDSTIKALNQLNSQIEQRLQEIVQRKGEVDSAALAKLPRDQIKNRLMKIKEMVRVNEKKASDLRGDLRSARVQAVEYKKQASKLKEKIDHHEDSIQAIHQDLKAKVNQVKKMASQMEKRDSTISRLKRENQDYLESLRKKDEIMNTAYIAVGPEKELEENGVIIKKGGFLGFWGQTPVLNPQFNQEDFKEFDIPNDRKIKINAKKRKVEMVTAQPDKAYQLKASAEGQTTLTITDEEQFWRAGNYLVITF